MTEFTQDQMVHIIVLNADRLFDTRAQPGWTKPKIVEAIIEKAQMIVEVDDPALNEYKIVGKTILSYINEIRGTVQTFPVVGTYEVVVVDEELDWVDESKPNPFTNYMPTHTPGLITLNEATGRWEATRDVEGGETEEEFNLRNAAFHKAERESKSKPDEPAFTPQQSLARVFGVSEK